MPHFPKVIYFWKKRNNVLVNYCENAAYYSQSPSWSIKEKKKKNSTRINKQFKFIQCDRYSIMQTKCSKVFTIIAKKTLSKMSDWVQ